MSKNTGTSELINYFDLGANGDVGISGSLTLDTIANATTDTDTFLVSDNGIIKYRTGAQLLSDIGAQGALTNPVTGTGTTNTLPKFTGASTIGNSIFTEIGGNTLGIIATNAAVKLTGSREYLLQTINSNGRFRIYDQTASIERVTLTSSGNVLIGSPPAADNGARLQVSGDCYFSDSVGIGTSTPQSQLHLSSTAPIMSFTDTNSFTDPLDRFIIRASENQGNVQWYDYSAATTLNIMTFIESGSVGIGTATPRSTTDVNGILTVGGTSVPSINIYRNALVNNAATFGILNFGGRYNATNYATGANISALSIGLWSASNYGSNLLFSTTPQNSTTLTERMRITSSGNVGIGTTTPSYSFDVSNKFAVDTSNAFGRIYLQRQTGNSLSAMYIQGADQANTANDLSIVNTSGGGSAIEIAGGTSAAAIKFFVNSSTVERMRITSVGNVGIGTGAPTNILHVQTPTGNDQVARFSRGPSNAGDIMFGLGDYGGGYQARIGAQQLVFEVNRANGAGLDTGTMAMFIKSSGNVLIGTTTDNGARLQLFNSGTTTQLIITGGDTSNQRLEVTDGTVTNRFGIFGRTNGDAGVLGTQTNHPLIFNTNNTERMRITSGGDVYLNNAAALFFGPTSVTYVTGSTTNMSFAVNTGERMRITSGGNVLIGTTTDNGNKLQVNGGASFSSSVSVSAGYARIIGGTFSVPASTTKTVTVAFNSGNIHAYLGFSSESGGITGSGSKSIFLGGTTNDGSGHTPTVISTFSYGDQVVGVGTTNTTSGFTFTIQNNKGSAVNWSWSAFGSFSTLTVT